MRAVLQPGPRTRRSALRLAAGAFGASAWLAACARTTGPVVLQLQAPADAALIGQMLPQFQRAEPGIRVNVSVSPAGGAASLSPALLAGSGPDVFWDNDPSRYLGTPLLLDLAPLIAGSAYDLTDFGPSVLAAFRFGQGLYMLPRSVSPSAYAARSDLFAAAGVSLPAAPYTATDLAQAWQRLSAGGRMIGGQLAWAPDATYYLNGWGGHLVDPTSATRCALQTPAALACGQWMWDRFWQDGAAQGLQGQYPGASFAAGTLAMQVVGCSQLPNFAGTNEGAPWRLVPFPTWPAGPSTGAQTDFYAISAATRAPEAAWRLLMFLSSAAWQRAAIATLLVCPARQSLWAEYPAAVGRRIPPLAHQPLDIYAAAVQGDWVRPSEQFRYQAQAAPLLQTYWQQMFGPGNVLTVKAGFDAAAAAVDAAEQAVASPPA